MPCRNRFRQSELVLQPDQGHLGPSNLPEEAAAASHHGDTAPICGHRGEICRAAPTTADTASANTDRAAAGGTGSHPTSTSSLVNHTRTASARCANRRNQPRTVSTGLPSTAAIERAPDPAAFAASAAPITDTTSARRTSANTGRRTCEPPHAEHRDRLGRNTTTPSRSRNVRGLAHPHGRSTPPHPGHSNPPPANRDSTPVLSTPTVSTAPPRASRPSRADTAKKSPGGPSHALIGTVPPPINTTPSPAHTKIRRHTQCPESARYVGTLSAVQQSHARTRV